MSRVIIENLFKIYQHPVTNIVALQDINLEVHQGELVGITGDAGAGKTTLIRLLGALDRPSAGEIVINDRSVAHLTKAERRMYWQQDVSFIWSHPQNNLLPYMSILENVKRRIHSDTATSHQRAVDLLTAIGLGEKLRLFPKHLPRVENQLVAVAAAVCSDSTIILADEPALGLPDDEAATIYRTIRELSSNQEIIVVLTAESLVPAQWGGTIIGLKDGILIEHPLDSPPAHLSARIDQHGRLQIPEIVLQQLGMDSQAEFDLGADYLKIAVPSTDTGNSL